MQSLLYHAYGMKDIEYLKTEYREGKVYFTVRTKDDKLCCSSCGSRDVIKKGVVTRIFKALPIGPKEVFLTGWIHRLECRSCGLTRQETIRYADKKKLTPVA